MTDLTIKANRLAAYILSVRDGPNNYPTEAQWAAIVHVAHRILDAGEEVSK